MLDTAPCIDTTQCKSVFGWGWTCGDAGFCEEVSVPARCQETWPEDLLSNPDDYTDSILLGINYDRSDFDMEVLAARLAVIQANEQGGLEGRSFGLIECRNEPNADFDDLSQEEANELVVRWLSEDIGVTGFVGPATSSRTEAAYLVGEPYGTLLISPSATSPALTALDGEVSTDQRPGLLWRTAPPDDLQGAAIARYMLETLNAQKVAVIHEVGPYGEGLADAFFENFTGSVTRSTFSNNSERDEAIASIGDADEVLFIAAEKSDLIAFFYAASQIAAFNDAKDPAGIFLADGAYYIDVFDSVADVSYLFEQVRGSRPTSVPGVVYDGFAAAYAAAFEGQNPGDAGYTAYAFDAMWLMLYGSAWSLYQEGEISGLGTSRGLRQISSGTMLDIKPSTWSLAREQFQSGRSIDVTGASGMLDYDPNTGETSAPIEIWRVASDGSGGFEFISEELIEP